MVDNKLLIGGAITASAICLHVLLQKRTISMSRNLYTITGNEWGVSVSRFSLLLGVVCASGIIQQQASDLFDGSSVVSNLSVWGLILSALFIGLGANFAGAGIETQMWTFLPNLDRWTIGAVLLTFLAAFGSVTAVQQKPDWLSFLFGSCDTPQIDQSNAQYVAIGAGVVFLAFVLYQFFHKKVRLEDIINMVISFLCGGLYALGLAQSGFAKKSIVQPFFDWSGSFKPDGGLAMLATFVINFIFFFLINRYQSPHWDSYPANDGRLYTGSILFGLGWGLSGLAIGPIVMISSTLVSQVLMVMLPVMLLGYELERLLDRVRR